LAKQYRVNAFRRINNSIISSLLHLGVNIGSFALLTVRGRKSGKPIETPIAIFAHEGKSYLMTPYGIVNWVRNLRAAGGEATITRSRRTEKIRAVELLPQAAAPIFREAVRSGPPGIPDAVIQVYRSLFVFPYLDVNVDSSLEEYEQEVLTHPVFLLRSVI
jgi:deazaflavin-dependent oxidoreductase (nitroreductase family)